MLLPLRSLLAGFSCLALVLGDNYTVPRHGQKNFLPVGAAVGSLPTIKTTNATQGFLLSGGSPLVTLDFGHEVAGYPFFVVDAMSGPAQVELKYSEQFDGLNHPFGDGPYGFAPQLSNTFRTETINVTKTGRYQSYFVQGGQRWASIQLLTPGTLTLGKAGFVSTIDQPKLSNLAGSFECSNELYNGVWELGTRAVAAACVDAGSQPATWDITSEGAYIRGQRPATSYKGMSFTSYTLTFDTKIARGGTGWAMADSGYAGSFQFLLVSDLPAANQFVNVNKTLTPPNTLIISHGWGNLVNQTTLAIHILDTISLGQDVPEDVWHTITTQLTPSGHLIVELNNTTIANLTLADYASIGHFSTTGSFGFGPNQDQAAYYRNAMVTDSKGTLLYNSTLTSDDVLAEYGVAPNPSTVCMDGAKRDRLVWLGDFFHTARIATTAVGRWDYVQDTIKYLLDWQSIINGQLPIDPPLSQTPQTNYTSLGLEDYQTLGMLAYTGHFQRSGDLVFVTDTWPAMKKLASFLLSNVNTTTGLATFASAFLGPGSGTSSSGLLAQSFRELAVVADAVNDTAAAAQYRQTATTISAGINKLLFNPALGIYGIDQTALDDFSVAGLAFAITSGTANTTQTLSALSHLSNATLFPGYKDSTLVNSSDPTINISPNTNGFLLDALLMSNVTAPAKYLLDTLWGAAMVSQDAYYSGASWEYVGQNLTPGLSLFTSLSHPWGGAPSYLLTDYIAGIRPVTPGYKTWTLVPGIYGFNLTYAKATVPTQWGPLSVKWELGKKGKLTVNVKAPAGTSGTLELPGGGAVSVMSMNKRDVGTAVTKTKIELGGGESEVVVQV